MEFQNRKSLTFDNTALSSKGKLVKNICYLTLAMVCVHLGLGVLFNYQPVVFGFIIFVLLTNVVILLLLRAQKENSAKILFLSSAYIFIYYLTPIYGYELNTHLYLIPGVGMALIFFYKEIGNKKWFFVFAGFPIWLVIELWTKDIPAIVSVPENYKELLGQINIGLTLITSFFMFYFFAKRSNEQLEEIAIEKERVESSVSRLTQFNNLLIHDLKSPLNNISSMLELIATDDTMTKEEEKELLGLLGEKANGAKRLVEGITNYFKETKNVSPQWIQSNELINDVLSLLTIPPSFKINIETLPQVYLPHIVIRQLIQNLITNAVKYNDKEEGVLDIFYIEDQKGGKLCFKDNGVGMTERQQNNAFKLFTLFHKMAQEQSSGMGLAIAKELVETNGGTIEVISTVGVGSQFNLCFPKQKFKK